MQVKYIDLGEKYSYLKDFEFNGIKYINATSVNDGKPHEITFSEFEQALTEAVERKKAGEVQ